MDAANIEAPPLFDGSTYSMSGNAKAITAVILASVDLPPVKVEFNIPVGTGGGCVTIGPLAKLEVPFGTVTTGLDPPYIGNPTNFKYKSLCLRRDLKPRIASTAKASDVKEEKHLSLRN